ACAAVGRSKDAGRHLSPGKVGRVLDWGIFRMPSQKEVGNWEELGAAGVKIVCVGSRSVYLHVGIDHLVIAGDFPGNYKSERLGLAKTALAAEFG
ncbi:MAG: hypothetical protein NT154_02850, partial [Verrucomicrobia bacterium]|nr:hypothetical protein [Verrucomicrobiota bacterium]